ncbi:unnamed protein product [Gadus morhua 'NCC']
MSHTGAGVLMIRRVRGPLWKVAENRGNRLWQRGRRRLQTPGGGVFLRPSAVKTLRAPPSRQGPLLLSSMTSQRGRQPGRPASACCHLALPPPGRVPGCRGTPKRASGSVRSAQIRALQQSAGDTPVLKCTSQSDRQGMTASLPPAAARPGWDGLG